MDLLIKGESTYYQLTGIDPMIEDCTPYILNINKKDLYQFDINSVCGVFINSKIYNINPNTYTGKRIYGICLRKNSANINVMESLIKQLLPYPNISVKGIYKRNKT